MTTISITLDNPGLVSSLKKLMLNINGVRDFRVTTTNATAVPNRITNEKALLLSEIREAVDNVNLVKKGKLQARPAKELLDEI